MFKYQDFADKFQLILFPQVRTSITHLTPSSSSSKRKLEADSRLLSPIARIVASIPIRQLYCLLLQQGSSSSLFQAGLFWPFWPQKRWTGHQIYRDQADLEVDPLCNLDPDLMGTSQVKNSKPLLCTRNPTHKATF